MRHRVWSGFGFCVLFFIVGCFTPQLLDTPYQEPIQSQREFSDEFNNPVHLGNRWKTVSGWWSIKDGRLFQKLPWRSSLPGDFQIAYVDGLASGPYMVETRLSFLHEGDQAAGILLRFQDQNNFYLLRMKHYTDWQDTVDLTQYINGIRREDLCRVDYEMVPGEWYTLRAEDRGTEIVAFVNGQELFRYATRDRAVGTVGLATLTGRVAFDRFSASLYEEEEGAPVADNTTVEPTTGNDTPSLETTVSEPGDLSEEVLGPFSEPDLPEW